jgi:hypothetical protein
MSEDLKLLGEAFDRPPRKLARVKPDGFAIGDGTIPALRGTISDFCLVRKLFRRRRVVCFSDDGISGSSGKRCEDCSQEDCAPRIRLHLDPAPGSDMNGPQIHLELNYSSSRNFIEYAGDLAATHHEVQEVVTSLSVEDRGKWGEVLFAVSREPTSEPHAP